MSIRARPRKSFGIQARGLRSRSGRCIFQITDFDKVAYIDAEDYARNEREALAGLFRQEMIFLGPKLWELKERLAEVEEFADAPLFDRIGHNGACFVYRMGPSSHRRNANQPTSRSRP